MYKSLFRDILNVTSSNIFSLISSIVTGLIVPLILGTAGYGYYRLFILYSTYTALLHFGFVDGILLKLGGKHYQNLNKRELRSESISFILLELMVSFVIILISLFINNSIYSFIFFAVGINTFLSNVFTYYQFISQATINFRGYSIRVSIQYGLNITITLVLLMFCKICNISQFNYKIYIFLCILVSFVMFLMCIDSYRDITFGKRLNLSWGIKRVIDYCKVGIYLTIAYQVSNLIMIIDNQIVSMFFKASIYGKYSFSYSMTNTAIIVLSAVATVLLPHLKRDSFHHMIRIYHKMISSMMLVVYFGLIAYFPLCMLVKIILPEYVQSLSYLKIFLPELGITCSVTMITFNYYNVLGKSKFYFYMSLVILAISTIIDSIMYIWFHNPVLVAFGSFIAIFIWYLASEYFLVKWYHVQWIKNLIYMLIMIGSFFTASILPSLIFGFGLYLVIYLMLSWIMFKNIIRKNVEIIMSKI